MKQGTTRISIYHWREQSYERELMHLERSALSRENKELITRFHGALFAGGTGSYRVAKLSCQLRKIALNLAKNLDQANKEDLERIIALFNRQEHLRESTKSDYRRALKQFFKWFEAEDPRLESSDEATRRQAAKLYHYLRNNVRTTYRQERINYSEVLTDEDIQTVIEKGAKTVKERAFIAVLHEAGLRAGEMLNLRLKDIEHKDTHALLRVDGKTGARRVTIVQSLPMLVTWLETHPMRDNPHAFLWVGDNPKVGHQEIQHGGAQKLIARCFERAGVRKRHNLHWFRHSRATILAPQLSEAVMCRFFGWELGSKQVRTYVHLGGQQVESAVLGIYGLEQQQVPVPVTRCTCGAPNRSEAKYCHRCGRAVALAVVLEQQRAEEDALGRLQSILADPRLRERFEQLLKQEPTR